MNQTAWDAMLLAMARQARESRTGWKNRRDTADLMARISKALGVDPSEILEKENAPAPADTGDER